jgi:hypothetical protein
MGESKRTPGPWKVRTFGPRSPGIDIADSDGRFLAAVKHSDGHTRPERGEALANAALIAAAPDLLEAAELFLAHHRIRKAERGESSSVLVTDTLTDRLAALRAAIAKAKGE